MISLFNWCIEGLPYPTRAVIAGFELLISVIRIPESGCKMVNKESIQRLPRPSGKPACVESSFK